MQNTVKHNVKNNARLKVHSTSRHYFMTRDVFYRRNYNKSDKLDKKKNFKGTSKVVVAVKEKLISSCRPFGFLVLSTLF